MKSFFTKVVGVTFPNEDGSSRQDIIGGLIDSLDKGDIPLSLERQLNNQHDPNAVAVRSPSGKQLGFLSKQVSETIAPILDDGTEVEAKAITITGGWPMHYGVNIHLSYKAA